MKRWNVKKIYNDIYEVNMELVDILIKSLKIKLESLVAIFYFNNIIYYNIPWEEKE